MKKILPLLALCLAFAGCSGALTSPDGRVELRLHSDAGTYSVLYDGVVLVDSARASLALADGPVVGDPASFVRLTKPETATSHVEAPLYRQAAFDFTATTLRQEFEGGYAIEWLLCDEGVAYRFVDENPGRTVVSDETLELNFPEDYEITYAVSNNPADPYKTSFENIYTVARISEGSGIPAFLPVSVDCDGVRVTLCETDLQAYPGMFVRPVEGTSTVKAEFAHYPASYAKYPYRDMLHVTSVNDYIADTEGARTYPWRILKITTDDTQLPVDNMVCALAEPVRQECFPDGTGWIKSGFSAWEWWNDWGLRNVPFEPGINMDTYKYYIDFASANGLEYVILDEGWYPTGEGRIMEPVPALDIPELVRYAAERDVRVILWAIFNTVDEQLDEVMEHYAGMGVAGFKIDFLDRNDQTAVEMAWRIAEAAAKRHLILDYHGIFPPSGLAVTFPNVVNFEGVHGLENCKWAPVVDKPAYDVMIPYLRNMLGYADYTQGAMDNASYEDFVPDYSNPCSMGTKAHQVALYVVLDSPLTMLCDSPTKYEREAETTAWIASLPRIYDEKLVLSGKMGRDIVVARRAGDAWYVGGLTGHDAESVEVSFGFLPEGEWNVSLYRDGASAPEYIIDTFTATSADSRTVEMASAGGFAMKITR